MLSLDKSMRTVTRDLFRDLVTSPLERETEIEFKLGDETSTDAADEIWADETEDVHEDYVRIKRKLMQANEIVSIQSTKYVYIGRDMGWNILSSAVTSKKICSLAALYAPVNFAMAADPIIEALRYASVPSVALPLTITQGDTRCSFVTTLQLDGRTLVTFDLVRPLNKKSHGNDRGHNSKITYCICPLRYSAKISKLVIPERINFVNGGYLVEWIYRTFKESTETILWILGDIMADFGNKRLFILYGPGNVGKTTVVNIISMLSSYSRVTIESRYIAKRRGNSRSFGNSLPENVKAKLASTRLALIGDLEITDVNEELNMQTVKECTGGDEGDYGKVSVTCIATTNSLFTYPVTADYTRPDRVRRVVVVPTVSSREGPDDNFNEPSDDQKRMLCSLALQARLKYDIKPPLTTISLLMTLFQEKFKYALSILVIDSAASGVECYIATRVLCHKFNISEEEMQRCLAVVGCNCCNIVYGIRVIANVTLKHNSKVYKEVNKGTSSATSSQRSRPAVEELDMLLSYT